MKHCNALVGPGRISCMVFIVLIFAVNPCKAQDFGRFRPGIRWKQINTPSIRVIFPEGIDSQAARVADNISYISGNSHKSIGPISKKINLILNNQGVISNGYVTLMPYHSEFYTTPTQDGFSLGTTPWLDLLSLHEYRHALQYANLRQGYTKLAWGLFGDQGWGALINITTPPWFLEGDAVATETALSHQGRGRMPSFLQDYKCVLGNDIEYSYMKARNGSFRDMVPDHYALGYLLCSYGRDKFGNDLWSGVIRKTAWLSGIIYPFSGSLESMTGLNTRKFYKKAMADYKDTWSGEARRNLLTPFTFMTPEPRTVTDYLFPVYQPDGSLLVYKRSYRQASAIYRVNPSGQETRLFNLGITQDPYFTSGGNLIAWTETTPDPRYSSIGYSDIVIYRTDLAVKKYLTRRQRLFSPAISSDGTRIIAVEVDASNVCRLKILDSHTGNVTAILPNPDNLYYTYPKWDTDGDAIISSARTQLGSMLIIRQVISTGTISHLSPEWNHIIGEVLVTPESILFTSGFSSINNIFSLSRSDGSLSQLTSSRYGAYHPALDTNHKRLIYSDFDITGYSLVSASTDSLMWKRIAPVPVDQMKVFDFKYFDKEGGSITEKIPEIKQTVEPYHKWQHPFNVHSWSLEPGFYSAGLNVVSDNIMGDLHLEAGARYYYTEKTPGFDATIKYGGFYPILSAGISRNYRHASVLNVLSGTDNVLPKSVDNQVSLGLEIPLDFSRGEYYRKASVSFGYNYISSKDLVQESDLTVLATIQAKTSFTATRKKAYQNISTPLGFGIEIGADKSVNSVTASRLQAIIDLSFRGLMANHNLMISAGWKAEAEGNQYQFVDQFIYPRGYGLPRYDRFLTIQGTYHFPLFYPDLGAFGILYCSRVRASAFADYGRALVPADLTNQYNSRFGSAGYELIFDTRWFNIADIPMGIRFSLLLVPDKANSSRKTLVEFFIPVLRL